MNEANEPLASVAPMVKFTQQVIQALLSCHDLDSLGDEIGQAGDLMAKFSMTNFTSDVYPEVDAEEVSEREAVGLRDALLRLLQEFPDHPKASSLLWALGKLSDPSLTPVFEQHLEASFRLLQRAYSHLSQCAYALDNHHPFLSEKPRSKRGQLMGPIINSADDFLRSRGILIPL